MFKKITLLLVAVFAILNVDARERTDYKMWAIKIADTEIAKNPQFWKNDSVPLLAWNSPDGVLSKAFLQLFYETDTLNYYKAVKAYAEAYVNDSGIVNTYDVNEYSLEYLNNASVLFDLLRITSNPKYSLAVQYLRDQLYRQPRTLENAFSYKKNLSNQLWLDGLYMAMPFYTRYVAIFNQPMIVFDDVVNQFLVVDKYTLDKKTGLNFQGWDASHVERWADTSTGHSKNFWSAGIAMYMISLIETLEYLPVNHPDRALLISVFQRVFKSVVKYQDKKTGMWYQVTNLKRQKSNFLESSSTAMFSYIIAKAINKGYLENKYQKNAEKAFDGILKNSTEENADGSISFINSSARASLGGNPYADGTFNYYVALPRLKDDPKLLAYMIMACLELEKFE